MSFTDRLLIVRFAVALLGLGLASLLLLGVATPTQGLSGTPHNGLVAADDVGWMLAEVHVSGDDTFEGDAFVEVEQPPQEIRTVFMAFDDDWNPRSPFLRAWIGPVSDSSYLRVTAPGTGDRTVATPDPAEAFEGEDPPPWNNSVRYRFEADGDDTLVGYIALMTSDPGANITVNKTSTEGFLGNATSGSSGATLTEAHGFDSVRFHGKVDEFGPTVTLDAREEITVKNSLLAAFDFRSAPAKAGYDGPGTQGYHCDQLVDDCSHLRRPVGPAGDYTFQIDRHALPGPHHEPWLLWADVERP